MQFIRTRVAAIFLSVSLPGISNAQTLEPAAPAPATSQVVPSGVGYKSVAVALEEIRAKPGVAISITKPDGWVIAAEPGGMVIWSFAPETHAAYPAVVRRAIVVGTDGVVRIETTGLCEAAKGPCDKLMDEFREMNAKAQQAIQQRLKAQRK